MSIKKLLGKVAVGAAVGALVIVGASAVVMAQLDHPLGGGATPSSNAFGSSENVMAGISGSSDVLPITVDLAARAYIYAIPASRVDGGKWAGYSIDSVTSIAGANAPIGNVGRLFVQTNMHQWDIVATMPNGGKLTREIPDDQRVPDPSAPTEDCITNVWTGDTISCTPLPPVYLPGKALMVMQSGSPAEAELELSIGMLYYDGNSAGTFLKETDAHVLIDAPLTFSATTLSGYANAKWASFAGAIGTVITAAQGGGGAADACRTGALPTFGTGVERFQAFAGDKVVIDDGGTPAWVVEDDGFPQIEAGPQLDVANEVMGLPDANSVKDYGIQFFINAKLAANDGLRKNVPGRYTEDLRLAFYGIW
jgi:hypothetical protein